MSRGRRRNSSDRKYLYIKDPEKIHSDKSNTDTNKMVRRNFVKVFLFLFVIMVFFLIYSRIANGASDMGLNAYTLSPDTDTKVRLEWSSVPGARVYRLYRDEGVGEAEIASIDVDTVLDPLSYNDTNLKPDTQYVYTIRSYSNAAGTQLLEGGTDEAYVRTTAMIRPYGLRAVYDINSRKAYLTWNHSTLAGSSIICRYESGQPMTERDVPQTSSAEESVYGPHPVDFAVKTKAAFAGYGVSEASDKVKVVPITAPSIKAEYINQSTVKISWDNSRYINLFQLESSRWDEAASSWGSWTITSSSLSGAGSTSTVTIGGKYRYRLSAKSGSGYTGVSNITEYVSNLAAPSDLTANIVTNGRIDLSWTNGAGNDGSLQVWRKAGGSKDSGTYSLLDTLSNRENSYIDLFSLVPGTTYHYKVNAVDASGNYSDSAYTAITAAVSAAPSSLRANVISADGISLIWNDNSNNEGGFKIERFDESSMAFSEIATVGTNTATYTDTGVVSGETYIYRVRSYNIMGNSPYSNEIIVNAWDPAAPTTLTVTPVSSTRLDLAWNYSGTENYNTIIERKTGAEGKWEFLYTTAAGVLKYSDTGLSPNTRNFYRVRKALGTGSAGIPYPNNEIGIGAYTYLGNIHLSGDAYSNNTIRLSWSGNNERADIIIERKMANGSFSALTTVGPDTNYWTDTTGLVPGASYTYRAKARTVTNESLYSAELTVRNYYLEAPSNLTISVDADQNVNLSWQDNSADETGFEIWRYTYGKSTYSQYAIVGQNATSFKDVNVEKGAQYMYLVRAYVTSDGLYSSFTNSVSMGVGLISPPVNLNYKYISDTQVLLEWTDTSDNEDGFKIERRIGTDGVWTTLYWVSKNQKSYNVTGLNPYTNYYFRVRAYNNSLNADSVSEDILVSFASPRKPTNVTAVSISSTQVKLSWKDNSDNEEKFRILRSTRSGGTFAAIAEVGKNIVTYLDNTVRADTNYFYKVEAVNSIGRSESSSEAGVRTNIKVRFTDTKGVPWAEEAIENMAGMGILKGVTDTLFKPGNVITRAEFTAVVVRAFNLETAPVGSLADVKSDKWYYSEVMIAENLGVISADANNRFYPESPITREDISLMIFKALEASGRKYSLHDNSVLEKFIDKDQISPHAVSSMAALVGEGIIEGLQGNAVGPKYAATRAQAAVFVYRALTKTEPGDE
ncbi:MAG: hypothetical protein GX279_06655 [Clostridiaceae bacterium]|nr:hypothetical protein [Clostridiaceae bacterium]